MGDGIETREGDESLAGAGAESRAQEAGESGARAEEELRARAGWSRLVEGPDPYAHRLIACLGAAGALTWLRRAASSGVLPPVPVGVEERPGHLARAVARWAPRLEVLDPARDLESFARLGGWLAVPGGPGWPRGLDDLGEDSPVALWGRGQRDVMAGAGIAIVGSRAATPYGMTVGAELAAGCADAGLVVVSGGAFGIDTAAHRGALAVAGRSVAVMAGGADRFYPRGSEEMLRRLLTDGAVVSEAAPGCNPGRHRFLSRNRLIAALSSATVVVEAAFRSGALSTARHAAGTGRPLGAVPGPVTSMASAGCHRLLREQDATCITTFEEAVELGRSPSTGDVENSRGLLDDLDPLQSRVLDALPAVGGADTDSIARTAGLRPDEVRSALGFLHLEGRVLAEGSLWRRARRSA
jgi:DNA processing protein